MWLVVVPTVVGGVVVVDGGTALLSGFLVRRWWRLFARPRWVGEE